MLPFRRRAWRSGHYYFQNSAADEKMVGFMNYAGTVVVLSVVVLSVACSAVDAYSLRDVLDLDEEQQQPADSEIADDESYITDPASSYYNSAHVTEAYYAGKRAGSCPPWKPFQCPEGTCIPLKYLCDYNVDCTQSGYDENKKMCTAALRPTVESTEEFLNHQLHVNGDDYFVKLFGSKAANRMVGLGGVSVVAVALTESPRLHDFALSVNLTPSEAEHLRNVLSMVHEGDISGLLASGFKESQVESLQPVVDQLLDTGFFENGSTRWQPQYGL